MIQLDRETLFPMEGSMPHGSPHRSSQSSNNSTTSNSPPYSSANHNPLIELFAVFFLLLFVLCLLQFFCRCGRTGAVVQETNRNHHLARQRQEQIQPQMSKKTAGSISQEEKRARILQALAPVRMVLESKHFVTRGIDDAHLNRIEEGTAENSITTEECESDTVQQPCCVIDADHDKHEEVVGAVVIQVPSAAFSLPPGAPDDEDKKLETSSTTRCLQTEMCGICLSTYQVGSDIVWSSNPSCAHVFHAECMEQWLMRGEKQNAELCPICRQDFLFM